MYSCIYLWRCLFSIYLFIHVFIHLFMYIYFFLLCVYVYVYIYTQYLFTYVLYVCIFTEPTNIPMVLPLQSPSTGAVGPPGSPHPQPKNAGPSSWEQTTPRMGVSVLGGSSKTDHPTRECVSGDNRG